MSTTFNSIKYTPCITNFGQLTAPHSAHLTNLYRIFVPQLITLRDGKVGVNFAGYHADAGLGGLLTGNSAHGGLSASAGTPWGSRAAAGIGGGLNGNTTHLLI